MRRCTHFYRISRICVEIDQDEDGVWGFRSDCGHFYEYPLADSTTTAQTVDFLGDKVEVIVRSHRDPDSVFRRLTHGHMKIEDAPANQKVGGIILLTTGLIVHCIALSRLYSYCVNNLFRSYFASRRAEKYLIKQEFEAKTHFPLPPQPAEHKDENDPFDNIIPAEAEQRDIRKEYE